MWRGVVCVVRSCSLKAGLGDTLSKNLERLDPRARTGNKRGLSEPRRGEFRSAGPGAWGSGAVSKGYAPGLPCAIATRTAAELQLELTLRESIHDGIEDRTGAHCCSAQRRVRSVVTTQIQGLALCRIQLFHDPGLVLTQGPGHIRKTLTQCLVTG